MYNFLSKLSIRRSFSLACCMLLTLSSMLSAGSFPPAVANKDPFRHEEGTRPKIIFSPLEHALMYSMIAICLGAASMGLYDLLEESKEELLELAGIKRHKVIEEFGKAISYQE